MTKRIILFLLLYIGKVAVSQEMDSIVLGPISLDSVEVFPFPSRAAFMEAFLAIPLPEEKMNLHLEYAQPPDNELEEKLAHLLPIIEVYPGIQILILPFYLGVGIDINMLYENSILIIKDKKRKRKKAKILPKFE